MLETIDLQQILVLDIETVSQKAAYAELPDHFQQLWTHKVRNTLKEEESAADVYPNAGLHAEFGKIICLSAGVFHYRGGQTGFRIKSFAHSDEKELLTAFAAVLQAQPPNLILCAHNGRNFDFPFICRRMLINGLSIPAQLDISGKKPWETNYLDTMELWRFGDFRSYTSLNLMAAVLDIPTPKDDISGEDVYRVYHAENNLDRIRVYCEKDIITTAQILRRLRGEPLIEPEAISFAE
ncbi:3'-5' exonuclease [Parapedobacter indicus]|uniref:Predicted 3'-5' exonuclease PolB-like domain-containing protein n=1 Tax=Parapedobacter indicus TaxID=1477437 RepID=A0A1I3SRM9_9SPHI|nr:3'-5' exonuclease [Parapedobacter indicus]PPK99741.1 hypothetical protein CLV26_11174 [Parapedobacter indicus]SFJ60449.1 hypothetical protein SAMN05444682_111125 [Parapedobacter indicus]